MEEIKKQLTTIAVFQLVIAVVIMMLFEMEVIERGILANEQPAEFIALTIMEIITIAVIPVAYRLFFIKKIQREIESNPKEALKKWGSLRLTLMGDAMIFNTLLYYIFAHVGFAYMAIILLLALIYFFPTKRRCEEEMANDKNAE